MSRVQSRALLIGCDFYFPCPENGDHESIRFPHLSGAVQDVNAVESFLVKVGVPGQNVVKLTASYNPGSPLRPVESDESTWPTHANIIRELERITEESAPGSLVYIHFSGHGIQRGKAPQAKTSKGGDTLFGAALATTDVLKQHGRYLTTNELGLRIQAMVRQRDLRVTLVLDACFSGRGLRNNTTYTNRTIPDHRDDGNLKNDTANESVAQEYLERISGTRQSTVTEDWLSSPTGCTVLTACGIHQTAGEKTFPGTGEGRNARQGVLTHWMLDILGQGLQGQDEILKLPSYTAVKEHVTRKICNTMPDVQQVPVLYGDTAYEFFGVEEHLPRPHCRVFDVSGDVMSLDVGSAQGVARGAIYDIYPAGVHVEDNESSRFALEASVVEVYDFRSKVRLTNETGGVMPEDTSCLEEGSGFLRAWALRESVSVKFVPDRADWKELLKTEFEKVPNLALENEDGGETFTVDLDEDRKIFEIFERNPENNGNDRLQRLPIIASDAPLAIQKLAYVLNHISRYRDIKKLQDLPRSSYIQEIEFKMIFYRGSEKVEAIDNDGVETFEVTEGEELGLRLEYRGPAPFVWVAIFELNASWGISQKLATKLMQGNLDPPGYAKPYGFSTEIPKKSSIRDESDTSDTFIAFVIEGEDEKSWDEIVLNELPVYLTNLPSNSVLGTYAQATGPTRQSNMIVKQVKQERRWGAVSFVVHSFPVANSTN